MAITSFDSLKLETCTDKPTNRSFADVSLVLLLCVQIMQLNAFCVYSNVDVGERNNS